MHSDLCLFDRDGLSTVFTLSCSHGTLLLPVGGEGPNWNVQTTLPANGDLVVTLLGVHLNMYMCACVRACVCVHACVVCVGVHACVCVCVCCVCVVCNVEMQVI